MKTLPASVTSMIKKPVVKKIIIIAVTVAAAFVLFVPTISRAFLTRYALMTAKDVLQMEVTISSAELHLLSGSVRINDMAIYHPTRKDETFIEVDRVDLGVSIIPLFRGEKPSLKVDINSPELVYATDKQGNWELKEQVPLFRRGEGEKRLPMNVDRITISDGHLEFRDGRVGKTTELSDIDIDVKRVQLPTEGDPLPAKFDMSFKIDGSAKYHMKGQADFLSPKISFDSDISLAGLPLPPFAPYYDRRDMPIRITRGNMAMTSHAKCNKDYLSAPAHMTLSRLNVEPKKGSIKGFAADRVVDGIKSRDGRLELDVMISGNIRNPNFHVANVFSKAFAGGFAKGMAEVARDVPGKVGDVGRDVGSKIKGLFGK
jgi:hypothetical protein